MVQRRHRVFHQQHEGATADARAIDVAWPDAKRLTEQRRRMRAGSKDAVYVADLETGIGHCVRNRFEVQSHLTLVRQHSHLVALGHADDARGVRKLSHGVSLGHDHTAPAGLKNGIVNASLSFVKTTSTGISQRITFGSGLTLTRFDNIRGPSWSSIIAST
jgi:hypothetical protein